MRFSLVIVTVASVHNMYTCCSSSFYAWVS